MDFTQLPGGSISMREGALQSLQSSIGIMEKKMETTIVYWGYIGVILGLYWDNGK